MAELKDLPVYAGKDRILKALEENSVIVVESPTGSGKTTGIPIILYEAGFAGLKKIGITQPRRIAALNVSSFIKERLSLRDSTVACKMRFYDETDDATKIKIMTDGILLEELKKDRLLSQYSVIMVDEAHERSLNIDFSLGLLKGILKEREDLRLIISSATINTAEFSRYFDDAPIISISGRMHDVDVIYSPVPKGADRDADLVEEVVSITQREIAADSGDILVFMPGEKLIKQACKEINRAEYGRQVVLYPLFSRLSKDEQCRVFTPTPKGATKIVVATNIAETSITIDGIKVVIDSGLQKTNRYNQESFISSLTEKAISKSNADQRKGRAGRTAAGTCYRLYDEKFFDSMDVFPTPEIVNADLSEVVLRMIDIGISDVFSFPFITPVSRGSIKSAYETLRAIDAVDSAGGITETGKFMVKFPLPPRLSRVLAESVFRYPGALANICTCLAFLSAKSPFLTSDVDPQLSRNAMKKFENNFGDLVAYLEIFERYRSMDGDREAQNAWCETNYLDSATMFEIYSVKDQLEKMLSELNIPVLDDCSEKEYLLCLCAGLRQFVCKHLSGREYYSVTADRVFMSPSTLFRGPVPEYILAAELSRTTKLYARSVAPLIEPWVTSLGVVFPKKRLARFGAGGSGRDGKEREGDGRGRGKPIGREARHGVRGGGDREKAGKRVKKKKRRGAQGRKDRNPRVSEN